MKASKKVLKNGLRVITTPMPTLESATLTIWVATGSRFEKEKQAGISHFLEHMAFKGGKKYKTAMDVAEAIDSIGGEFNASTSTEYTNFYVRAGASSLEKAFDVLSDMLLNPKLAQSDIDREKGVIVEEIGMYEDTPRINVWNKFQDTIYQGNTLGRDVIGTKKTVTSLTKSDFRKYRDMYYFGENMIITVSGGVTEKEVLKLVNKYFGSIDSKPEYTREVEFEWKETPKRLYVQNKKNEQANIVFGYPGNKHGEKNRYVEAVLSTILGGGMSSRLFTEVREKRGLAYSVTTDTDHSLDTGYFSAYAGVDPKKAEAAIKVMLEEHYKLTSKNHGVTKKEFEKAKEYLRGHMSLGLESTKAVNAFFGYEELMAGKLRTPEEAFKGIEKVKIDDVLELAREIFDHKRLHMAIIGPFSSNSKFEKILK